jgi:tetratricopeptide (TPR) repeat protein
MKTLAKLMAAGLALLIVNIAFASATLRDVQTAVTVNKDFRQAENLIREVVANDPNSARDHYVYSQILRHNGKHDDALRELTEAKRLDPAITFDKNPARVFAYEASLKAERGRRRATGHRTGRIGGGTASTGARTRASIVMGSADSRRVGSCRIFLLPAGTGT